MSAVITLAGAWTAHAVPAQPITIARPAFGGQALFEGRITLRNGCFTTDSEYPATILFDPDVTLSETKKAIRHGAGGAVIALGNPSRASAAWLRQDNNGWSIEDIETFYGVEIPINCPTANVVRLHDFEPIE